MMATTHILAGITLAAGVALLAPEFALVAVVAGAIGGLVPDFDVVASHRRTLHFPIYYSSAFVVTTGFALFLSTPLTVALACFFLAAACHSVADAFGGGLALRPWEDGSNRAVYSHYHGRWISPRRWIGYDGSPADLALAAGLALVCLFVFAGSRPLEALIVGLLVVSIAYTVCRKLIGDRLETVSWAPDWVEVDTESQRRGGE